jgi:glutathione S-transferase
MDDYTLHQQQISGNCYKIRLTAALVGVKLKTIEYDIRKGETRTPEYLSTINAAGKIPVLEIGKDTFLPESSAACYYLATGSRLIPSDRLEHAQMLRWMFFEQFAHEPAIASLRWWITYVGVDNLSEEQKYLMPVKRRQGEEVLGIMDQHLASRKFFVAEKMTLADIALFAYTHVADEGEFDLGRWPNVKAWCERVKEEPGYVSIEV